MSGNQDMLIEFARRKERLIARAEAQRATLAGEVRQLHGPIGIADRGLRAARFLRAHPIVAGIALAAVMALRGRSFVSLAARALAVWRLWRSLSAWSGGPLR